MITLLVKLALGSGALESIISSYPSGFIRVLLIVIKYELINPSGHRPVSLYPDIYIIREQLEHKYLRFEHEY